MTLAQFGTGENLTMSKEHAGDIGWGLLIGYVVAWDILAPETLSSATRRHMEHPTYRFLLTGVIGATALHLIGLLPEEYDPFRKALEWKNHEQALQA